MVETESDTLCCLFLTKWVDIDCLAQIIENSQFCVGVSLGYGALGLTELGPTAVHGFSLGRNGAWETRLLTPVVVGKLCNDKRHLRLLPKVTPASYQLLQVVCVWGRITRI